MAAGKEIRDVEQVTGVWVVVYSDGTTDILPVLVNGPYQSATAVEVRDGKVEAVKRS